MSGKKSGFPVFDQNVSFERTSFKLNFINKNKI